MKKSVRFLLIAAPAIYMIAVWIMSGLPHNTIIELPNGKVDLLLKESLHLVEFAILYALIVLALLANSKLTPAASLLAAMFASVYGLVDEIHQAFVPYRSATVIDAVKDVIGVSVAFWLIQICYFNRKTRLGKWLAAFEKWVRSN